MAQVTLVEDPPAAARTVAMMAVLGVMLVVGV